MRQLQAYELMINDGVLVQSKGEANLAIVTSFGPSGNKRRSKSKRSKMLPFLLFLTGIRTRIRSLRTLRSPNGSIVARLVTLRTLTRNS